LFVRRSVSIQVLLALAPIVFSAPFLHLHLHEDSDHFLEEHSKGSLVTHPHLAVSGDTQNPGFAVSALGDDAVPLDWFPAGPQPGPSLEFVAVATPVVPVPEPGLFWMIFPDHRSHDPPPVVSTRPRSPPATRVSCLGA